MPGGDLAAYGGPESPPRTAKERGMASTHCFERHSSTITPRHLLSSSAENSALRCPATADIRLTGISSFASAILATFRRRHSGRASIASLSKRPRLV